MKAHQLINKDNNKIFALIFLSKLIKSSNLKQINQLLLSQQ